MKTIIRQCGWETMRTLRNRQFVIFSLVMPVVFYFILTNTIGATFLASGMSSKVYFLVSMAAFSAVSSCLFGLSGRLSFERNQGWLRLVRTTPMRNYIYIFSKILGQLMVGATSTLVLFLIGAFFEGAQLSLGTWVFIWISMTFGAIPFISLGILLGIILNSDTVNIAVNILNILLTILGGMWWPLKMMPKVIQHIGYWLPTNRYAQISWDISTGKSIRFLDIAVLLGYTVVFILVVLLILRRQEERYN